MFSIECKDVIDVSNALETVRQMVLNGTLDVQLASGFSGNSKSVQSKRSLKNNLVNHDNKPL